MIIVQIAEQQWINNHINKNLLSLLFSNLRERQIYAGALFV
jgi:hypothetical protein